MTQGNDMGTVLLYLSPCLFEKMLQGDRYKRTVPCVPSKGPSLVSLVSHFSETHGDRYKRTVPLNLDKDIVQLQNTGVLNIFGNR